MGGKGDFEIASYYWILKIFVLQSKRDEKVVVKYCPN
jgi:hypothetical protein